MRTKFLYFSILGVISLLFFAVGFDILSLPGFLAPVAGILTAGIPITIMGSPQQKMMDTAAVRGENLARSQGTSRTIWDTLAIETELTFKFFVSVGQRAFPFTNVPDNKEDDGESITIQRISFQLVTVVAGEITTIESIPENNAFFGGQFVILLNNNRVIKPYAVRKLDAKWNPYASFGGNDTVEGQQVIILDNFITIPPRVRYALELELPAGWTPPEGVTHISCMLDGAGAISRANSAY